SILTTVILADMGGNRITMKAQDDYHEKILKIIGANHVVHRESDNGKRLAHRLISNNHSDYMGLSDSYSMVEVKVGKKMAGKSLVELNIRAKYGCNVVAVKQDDNMSVSPAAEYQLKHDDILIVIGADKDLSRFEKQLVIE